MNPAILAAHANPEVSDGPHLEMAVVQAVEQKERREVNKEGEEVMTQRHIPLGHVHQVLMLPAKTSFHPPANTTLIGAGGRKPGDVVEQLNTGVTLSKRSI